MNANELADMAENACCAYQKEIATMLRQQQAEIEALKELMHQRFDDGKRLGVLETENKFKLPPCAWMVKTNDGKKLMLYGEEQPPKFADEVQAIPLYTHPSEHDLGIAESIGFDKGYKAATAKTLTDAETALKSLYEAVIRYENLSPFPDNYAVESCEYQLHDAKEKARAILKKASEK